MSKNKPDGALEKFELARNPKRPTVNDYIKYIFTDFIELHGDRAFGDDSAMLCGIGYLNGRPVTVIGSVKGSNTKENIKANFGMAHPEGYRKALRQMKLAEKFHRPIITFVDTPGAYCGIEAEERGQGEAIARNLYEMMGLRVPVISVMTGEGGSGGALGIAVANKVLMLENSFYSVISPKGFASILWKDASREKEAAVKLKMTAEDLYNFKVIDRIIKEVHGGAHNNPRKVAENVKNAVESELISLENLSADELVNQRYDKFRAMGYITE